MKYKNFQFEEDPFAKNARGIAKTYHKVILIMKFLQTKPQVKKMNIKGYDLFYTDSKNRDEKEIVKNRYEKNQSDFIVFDDFIIPIHKISFKSRDTNEKSRSNVMTMARIQPFCRAIIINLGYFDGTRVFLRSVTDKKIAFFLHNNHFCLIWK